jgi:hypothetical protein
MEEINYYANWDRKIRKKPLTQLLKKGIGRRLGQ